MRKLMTKLDDKNVGAIINRQKGITLIALVITIVVLLILAAVAINLTIGENGIFKRAEEAKLKYEIAQAKEELDLKIAELQVEKQGTATLQDVVDMLKDEDMNYVVSLEEIASITGVETIGDANEIYVVYKIYQFRVDDRLQTEFISIVEQSEKIRALVNDKDKFEKFLENTDNINNIINNSNYIDIILESEIASSCIFNNEYACEKIFGGEKINENWINKILKSEIAIKELKKNGESTIKNASANSIYPQDGEEKHDVFNVLDKNVETSWISYNEKMPTLTIELENAVALYEFEITNRSGNCISSGGHWETAPLEFKIMGSNDNFETSEILGQYTGKNEDNIVKIHYAKGEKNIYRIQNITQKYKYYRIIVESIVCCAGNNTVPCNTGYVIYNGIDNVINVSIAEISLFGK